MGYSEDVLASWLAAQMLYLSVGLTEDQDDHVIGQQDMNKIIVRIVGIQSFSD
jgi:hypothetical protein